MHTSGLKWPLQIGLLGSASGRPSRRRARSEFLNNVEPVICHFYSACHERNNISNEHPRRGEDPERMARMHDGTKSLAIENGRAESAAGYIRTSASLPRPEYSEDAQDAAIALSCEIVFGRLTGDVR